MNKDLNIKKSILNFTTYNSIMYLKRNLNPQKILLRNSINNSKKIILDINKADKKYLNQKSNLNLMHYVISVKMKLLYNLD